MATRKGPRRRRDTSLKITARVSTVGATTTRLEIVRLTSSALDDTHGGSSVHLDLHRHLEGSHSAHALVTVARAHDIRSPLFYDAAAGRWKDERELASSLTMAAPSDDPMVFYRCIVMARQAYVSTEAIGALSALAFREASADSDGFEMRLSLFSMTRTLIEHQRLVWREVPPAVFAERYARPILLAVLAARDQAQAATGTPMLVRLGLSRTFESEPHYRALALMVEDHAQALCGLDVLGIVSGPDTEPLPAPLLEVLAQLRRRLPDLTIHAGEFAGPASVERSLWLEPRGIGHGVRSLESPATLAELSRRGVTLEVCPTSNRLLIPSALRALALPPGALPLGALQRAQVHCVLGSDDPTPMGTSFGQELTLAKQAGVDLALLEADSRRRWREITGADPKTSST